MVYIMKNVKIYAQNYQKHVDKFFSRTTKRKKQEKYNKHLNFLQTSTIISAGRPSITHHDCERTKIKGKYIQSLLPTVSL